MSDTPIPKVVVISQARMTSTRLPGKILKTVSGISLLQHHVDRLQNPNWEVMVATTVNAEDDSVEEFCKHHHLRYYRGSESHVLSRYSEAARESNADIVVRVTSDCPLIDSSLIQEGLTAYLKEKSQRKYLSNCFPRTYARGFDFEIFPIELLNEAVECSEDLMDIEHVTPYIWKNKPGDITLLNISQKEDRSSMRICVDTVEDFQLIQILIEKYNCDQLSYSEIEELLISHPELTAINEHIEQKKT